MFPFFRFGLPLWDILGTFFATFSKHFFDVLLRSVFDSIWPHFGTVLGPISLLKTKKNLERVVEFSVFSDFCFRLDFEVVPRPFWSHFWTQNGTILEANLDFSD